MVRRRAAGSGESAGNVRTWVVAVAAPRASAGDQPGGVADEGAQVVGDAPGGREVVGLTRVARRRPGVGVEHLVAERVERAGDAGAHLARTQHPAVASGGARAPAEDETPAHRPVRAA